jgi:hypothetical protein
VFDEDAHEESSWTTPLRVLVITLVLSIGFIYYYFGPTVDDIQGNIPVASVSDRPISLSIGGRSFVIPENYTQFPRARRGGVRENVALYARLPDYEPYAADLVEEFETNSAYSPIVHFQIESYRAPLNERQRVVRSYMPVVIDPKGEEGPAGLTLYRFSEGSGYFNEDLFLGDDDRGGLAVIRCTKQMSDLLFPYCRRDTKLLETVGLSYRFRRSRLADWRSIDNGIHDLAISFMPEEQE